MACHECGGWDPETGDYHVDHGFREPDTRKRYYVGDDEEDLIVVTVTIQREWGGCPCGSGYLDVVGTSNLIKGDDGTSLVVPDTACCETIIKGLYPGQKVQEEDVYDGERELWRMENGYYD